VHTRLHYLGLGIAVTLMPVGVITAPSASADCTSAGYATVCAQGDVRGGGGSANPSAVYPSYCADPWYCDDDWGVDVVWNPGNGIGGPGRPGRPGGIGPR